jgi:hypothetical protein
MQCRLREGKPIVWAALRTAFRGISGAGEYRFMEGCPDSRARLSGRHLVCHPYDAHASPCVLVLLALLYAGVIPWNTMTYKGGDNNILVTHRGVIVKRGTWSAEQHAAYRLAPRAHRPRVPVALDAGDRDEGEDDSDRQGEADAASI